MQLLKRENVLSKDQYEEIRPDFRRKIIRQKKDRIVGVGNHATFHFESYDTMLYQVQEMIRTENLLTEKLIEEEIEAYNPVIPGKNELSVTMMLEYETVEEREVKLPLFVGIDEHVFIQIGKTEPVKADFDAAQISEDQVSSVQYTKFRLTDEQTALLAREGTVVRAIITHPHYQTQAVLGENVRRAIQDDPQ